MEKHIQTGPFQRETSECGHGRGPGGHNGAGEELSGFERQEDEVVLEGGAGEGGWQQRPGGQQELAEGESRAGLSDRDARRHRGHQR